MTPRRRAALARLETRLARGAADPPRRHPGAPVLERRTQTPLSALRATPDGSREPHANTVSESGVPSLPADLTLFDGDRCPACGGPIERAATGRPATYCSANCRLQAFRRETKLDLAPTSTPTVEPANSLRKTAAPKDLAAIAAGIPTPADSFGLARAYCEVRGGGFAVVFGRDAGRVHEPVGPVFKAPRQAIDLADLLNARLVAA